LIRHDDDDDGERIEYHISCEKLDSYVFLGKENMLTCRKVVATMLVCVECN